MGLTGKRTELICVSGPFNTRTGDGLGPVANLSHRALWNLNYTTCQNAKTTVNQSEKGIHILLGENFEEIVSSPTDSVTFGSNTDFGALISAWEVESQAARDGQIVLRMAITRPTVVLILDPVD